VEEEAPNGISLIYYFFPELEDEYVEAVDVTPEVMAWLSDLLGPYPFESYGQATYYAMGISMEMQTMTLLSYQMLDERTVVHELSHSWLGNWVGIESWGDTWWKEGLATYMEVLWLSQENLAERERLMAEIAADVSERGRDYPLDQPPRDRIMSFDAYYRGAQFMYALHQEIGDDAFFSGLRAFLAQYGGSNASDDALLAAMEEAAGRELDALFVQWLSASAPE
jgi:aminopeptidase N